MKDALKNKEKKYKKEFIRYTGATKKSLSKSIVTDIDPQIRNAVIELNKNGFKTILSCAGHLQKLQVVRNQKYKNIETGITKDYWYTAGNGYVVIYKKGYNKEGVFNILKKHGLINIKEYNGKFMGILCVLVTFNPIGKKPDINDIGSGLMIEKI
jgi:hypothetical protein